MKKIFVKRGEILIQEGTHGDCAYIVESGSFEVSLSSGKRSKILGTLGEKDIIGELGLIDGLPRSCTVTALEDSTVSVITQENFDQLTQKNPKAIIPIFKILTRRLRNTIKILEETKAQVESAVAK